MIKANELRIGNWVLINGEVTTIRGITDAGNTLICRVEYKNKNGEYASVYINYVQPIPLTEEWLERFGFEKDKVHTHWTFGNFIIDKNTFDQYFLCDIDATVIINFVHQLQNLYFALTGEELELDKK